MSENYLYILRDGEGRLRYVGIGGRQRPYELHNDEYDELIAQTADVRITARPFRSRSDAEMAESLLIRALVDAEASGVLLTNRAKVKASKDLVPLVPQAPGVLEYTKLRNTILVRIQPSHIDDREVVSGLTAAAVAAERCRMYWDIRRCVAEEFDVQYLVAVSTRITPVRVLGSWRTQPTANWDVEGKAIAIEDPDDDNALGYKGMEFSWAGYPAKAPPQKHGFSVDLH